MEVPYRNRELDDKFEEIRGSLNRIEEQTTKTNGKVASLILWRAYITGALALLTFLTASVFIPLVFMIVAHHTL